VSEEDPESNRPNLGPCSTRPILDSTEQPGPESVHLPPGLQPHSLTHSLRSRQQAAESAKAAPGETAAEWHADVRRCRPLDVIMPKGRGRECEDGCVVQTLSHCIWTGPGSASISSRARRAPHVYLGDPGSS